MFKCNTSSHTREETEEGGSKQPTERGDGASRETEGAMPAYPADGCVYIHPICI